jgi:hypothetical protein
MMENNALYLPLKCVYIVAHVITSDFEEFEEFMELHLMQG